MRMARRMQKTAPMAMPALAAVDMLELEEDEDEEEVEVLGAFVGSEGAEAWSVKGSSSRRGRNVLEGLEGTEVGTGVVGKDSEECQAWIV